MEAIQFDFTQQGENVIIDADFCGIGKFRGEVKHLDHNTVIGELNKALYGLPILAVAVEREIPVSKDRENPYAFSETRSFRVFIRRT